MYHQIRVINILFLATVFVRLDRIYIYIGRSTWVHCFNIPLKYGDRHPNSCDNFDALPYLLEQAPPPNKRRPRISAAFGTKKGNKRRGSDAALIRGIPYN